MNRICDWILNILYEKKNICIYNITVYTTVTINPTLIYNYCFQFYTRNKVKFLETDHYDDSFLLSNAWKSISICVNTYRPLENVIWCITKSFNSSFFFLFHSPYDYYFLILILIFRSLHTVVIYTPKLLGMKMLFIKLFFCCSISRSCVWFLIHTPVGWIMRITHCIYLGVEPTTLAFEESALHWFTNLNFKA